MENFTGDFSERLPFNVGFEIINKGKRIGEGTHQSDCYWSGYEYEGKYYISLNDYEESVWETSKDNIIKYCSK